MPLMIAQKDNSAKIWRFGSKSDVNTSTAIASMLAIAVTYLCAFSYQVSPLNWCFRTLTFACLLAGFLRVFKVLRRELLWSFSHNCNNHSYQINKSNQYQPLFYSNCRDNPKHSAFGRIEEIARNKKINLDVVERVETMLMQSRLYCKINFQLILYGCLTYVPFISKYFQVNTYIITLLWYGLFLIQLRKQKG